MFEFEVFRKQMYCIEENTCDIIRTFRRLPQLFGVPIVIRGPGNCAPLVPPLYPPRYALCVGLLQKLAYACPYYLLLGLYTFR